MMLLGEPVRWGLRRDQSDKAEVADTLTRQLQQAAAGILLATGPTKNKSWETDHSNRRQHFLGFLVHWKTEMGGDSEQGFREKKLKVVLI